MKRPRKRPCPTPGKVAFRSEREAQRGAAKVALEMNQRGQYFRPMYGYLCPCGSWHQTSWPTGPAGEPNELLRRVPRSLQMWAMGVEQAATHEDESAQRRGVPLRST